MKKKVILVLCIIILLSILIFIVNKSKIVQAEHFYDEESGYTGIIIDGVKYIQLENWFWYIKAEDKYKEIGKDLYSLDGNLGEEVVIYTPKNGIFTKEEYYVFIRSDIEIPTFSPDNIKSVGLRLPWNNSYYSKDCFIYHTDYDLISKLFLLIEQTVQLSNDYYVEAIETNQMRQICEIVFFGKGIDGIEKTYRLYAMKDKYWIDLGFEYSEVSTELLSELIQVEMPDASDIYKLTEDELNKLLGIEGNK